MDEVLSAAINDMPLLAVPGDVPRHGPLTLADRIFTYRALAALCGAGMPLTDAFEAIADAMRDPDSHPKEGPRIRHYAVLAARELAKSSAGGVPRPLGALLDGVGFVMDDVERCMFALDPHSVDPRDLAVALRGGLEFLVAVQSTAKGVRR